ncbi:flagellar rod assembly protein/muramidase FlgJ [Botrimarina colliarenosi]|uniref:Flagellar rod assembly protein/muramidase FlgJ n=1 Tax=Botrimarina colliarenosi TaxID=2528001 RepID=A0A5C6AJL1_9BACT|nr:rod-binding protein [Botrimarina colliarenosi]TWT99365.1 flagellar rod assembly protein/muramidase FlgJ [Botrimarina colliarenosi]
MTSPVSLASLTAASPARAPVQLTAGANHQGDGTVEKAEELKEAFTQFVGETFFGQMLKAMRSSVGEPAYFHGGMAEEQFQSQLDAQMSQEMAQSGGGQFADGMFRQQFPDEAALLDASQETSGLAALNGLRRR